MDMLRILVRWTGFVGAPGYTALYFAGGGGLISDATQVANRVYSAFNELTAMLPQDVTLTIESEAQVVNSDTGIISDFVQVEPIGTISGTATGGYSAASGAVVNWRTDDVRFGRRIRGRTFIVPMAGLFYENDGTITSAGLANLNDFADTLTSWDFDSEFGVWSRPRNGSGGVFATATGFNVPDMAAVLRSRRD